MQFTKILKKIFFIYLLFFCIEIFAQEPIVLSLQDTILLALRDNPNIESAKIQRVIDKFNLRLAQWNYQLHYGFTGSTVYTKAVTGGVNSESDSLVLTPTATLTTPIGTTATFTFNNPLSHTAGASRYYNPSVGLTITQPLLQGFGTLVGLAPLHVAENQELINRLTLKGLTMSVITNVITQYAGLVQAQNSIEAQKLSLKNAIATLEQQRAFLKVGRIAPSDLVQFESNVASQKLSLEQLEVTLQQQQRLLLIALGINPNTPIKVQDKITFADESIPPLDKAICLALKNNVAYQTELITLSQAKVNLDLATDKMRPTLNLVASRVQGNGSGAAPNAGLVSLINGANSNTSVGLNLTVPVDNLALKQAYMQNKIALQQEYIRLANVKRQVTIDVINAYNVVLNQREQIKQAQLAVELAQKTLDIAQAKLKYGKVTPFEVSTLQTTLISQQLTEINTISAYYSNLGSLDQVIGITLCRWNINIKY